MQSIFYAFSNCFLVFRPGGKVCRIFEYLFEYKARQKWENFDFRNENEYNSMMNGIFQKLIELKCFRQPNIYIRLEIDDSQKETIVIFFKDQCEFKIAQNEDGFQCGSPFERKFSPTIRYNNRDEKLAKTSGLVIHISHRMQTISKPYHYVAFNGNTYASILNAVLT